MYSLAHDFAQVCAQHWTVWLVTVVLILAAVIDGFELKVPNWVTFPFVISGWYVDTVLIHDTTKAFEIKDNYVSNILVLDWTAQGGYVHHDHIENLRTNRNVQRVGDPTAAVIENNEIMRVQELRQRE